MKLKELLEEIFEKNPPKKDKFGLSENTLYGESQLKEYKEKLLQCEEFSECTELYFLDTPVVQTNNEPMMTQSFNVVEGQKFKGKCYLLSLMLTPELYNPNSILNSVKNGACISRTIYNPDTFEPFKKLVLEFSPERKQDGITNHEAVIRQELHDLLDKVLDNPEDYQVKGIKRVMVRGIFEEYETIEEVKTTKYLSGVVDTEPKFAQIYFWKKDEITGKITMTLTHKNIPLNLVDKFTEELGDKKLDVTEEEINKFLEKYN
jgi:hypothetical protein